MVLLANTSATSVVAILCGLAVLVFVGQVVDKALVSAAAESKGWKDVAVRWAWFAPGSFPDTGERHYRVTYTDDQGQVHSQYCKIGWLTGIYPSVAEILNHECHE